jgi:hypothetical protein
MVPIFAAEKRVLPPFSRQKRKGWRVRQPGEIQEPGSSKTQGEVSPALQT